MSINHLLFPFPISQFPIDYDFWTEDERFDYASKLKSSMEQLRKSGELLAKYQLEKQIAASREDFERAKEKKMQMESLRESLYKTLRVKELLEPNGVSQIRSPAPYPSLHSLSFFLFRGSLRTTSRGRCLE